jgi:DNA repair photolyase
MSIDVFWGGFLEDIMALEYSGNICQHGCSYCFANANKQERHKNVTGAIGFLYNKTPSTYKDALWREGYPICISNRSDPFSPNNLVSTEALFEHLKGFPNGVLIQTKTNKNCVDLIDILGPKKAVVFVSVPMLDERIAKIVEPGAPLPKDRLDVMRKLIAKGYHVQAGINPIEQTWLPLKDFDALIAEIKSIGVNHVYMNPLNLSKHRLQKISPSIKNRLMGAENLSDEARDDYADSCAKYLIDSGFELYYTNIPGKSGYHNETKKLFYRTMPTLQDYVNHCYEQLTDGGYLLLKFKDFFGFISRSHPIFKASFKDTAMLRGYLIRVDHELWKAHREIPSLYQMLNIYWNDRLSGFGLWGNPLFAEAMRSGKLLRDESRNPILYFDGEIQFDDRKEVM